MVSPNQIKTQTFASAGRGAYRAADVDAFMQEIYISFTELTSENASMKRKFASLSSIIDEYNAGKNAIATALVKAQAVADETMRTAKEDASSIVSDAKEEANNILNEAQDQAETYAREKKEAADAYFSRAESELQRVMAEAKTQSEAFVREVNDQAAALIADANEKAAAIVGAAYKDAKVAKEKTQEIIERANVEIETTRNEVMSFKESALQMLSSLLPLVEGIDPDSFVAPDLTASTEIPQLTANSETAPAFELHDELSDDDISAEAYDETNASPEVSAPAEEAFAETEPGEAQPFDDIDLSKHDDLIARMQSLLQEKEPVHYEQESLFDEVPAPEPPAYHPFEPAQEAEAEQDVFEPVEEEPLFEEIDSDDEDTFDEADANESPASFSEEYEEEDDDEDDIDDDEEEDDAPREPFKFRLTKNFDIFDDDNE